MSLSLSMVQNKTGVFFLSVFQSDGVTPQTLVGSILWFHAAIPGGGWSVNKSSPSSGITVNNSAGGQNCATLQIEPIDTANLSAIGTSGVIALPCELTLQNGSEAYELASGSLQVSANVGTP